jgi:hypothetical protein
MQKRGRETASQRQRKRKATSPSVNAAARSVPEIYEVVIECRHEAEQRAVFERMCGEGFCCRVMTL